MLVSLNWLREYVNLQDLSVDELAEKITKSGIEVDGIHYIAEKSTNVVVGHVLSCAPHPDADRLNVCEVDVGTEILQIVCGASNVAKGQKVPVAKPGAVLPGNFKIKKTKLRGVESSGMICSLKELGIEKDYIPKAYEDGIFVFPKETSIGEPVDALLNLNDVVLEFDLTPNRADALSMLGVAYEVAAILDEEIHLPKIKAVTGGEQTSDYVSVSIEDSELNPYYAAFVIRDVEISESPLWMKNYLIASGIRPINNVVDITNFVLLEYGQPLHAFDYDLLNSKEIVTRRAEDSEKLTTLDAVERTLRTENLVITNGKEPVALAGVMGGQSTEVRDTTKNILLEAAYFEGSMVRTTVRDTGLRSDSSNRFEKGVDPNRIFEAGQRAADLFVKYAGGTVLKDPVVVDQLKQENIEIKVSTDRVNDRLGTNISVIEIKEILRKLRFSYKENAGLFTVHIPSRRQDVRIFEDMLEEIARIYGYDHLPYTLPKSSTSGGLTQRQWLKREVKKYLEGAGLRETITYSLTEKSRIGELVSPDIKQQSPNPVRLSLPMTEEHEYLRISLLPELVKVKAHNEARYEPNMHIYEIGSIFLTKEIEITKQPVEKSRLAGLASGKWLSHPWQQEEKEVDFFMVKGIVEGLFHHLQIECSFVKGEVTDMHPGQTALIEIEGKTIGFVGQIHPTYAKNHDIGKTFVFDIDFDLVTETYERKTNFTKIPRFPSIARDIALIVDENVEASAIQESMIRAGGELLQDVYVFDLYEGDNLEASKKSIAYHLIYQHPEKTLQDKDVEESYKDIVEAIEKEFKAQVRS